MSATDDAIVDCRQHILSKAGPLNRMTTAARKGFADYMRTVVKWDGQRETRAWHCANNPDFKESFMDRLSWVGHYAMESAKARHQEVAKHGEAVRHMVSIELEDLFEAETTVAKISGTGVCIP